MSEDQQSQLSDACYLFNGTGETTVQQTSTGVHSLTEKKTREEPRKEP